MERPVGPSPPISSILPPLDIPPIEAPALILMSPPAAIPELEPASISIEPPTPSFPDPAFNSKLPPIGPFPPVKIICPPKTSSIPINLVRILSPLVIAIVDPA